MSAIFPSVTARERTSPSCSNRSAARRSNGSASSFFPWRTSHSENHASALARSRSSSEPTASAALSVSCHACAKCSPALVAVPAAASARPAAIESLKFPWSAGMSRHKVQASRNRSLASHRVARTPIASAARLPRSPCRASRISSKSRASVSPRQESRLIASAARDAAVASGIETSARTIGGTRYRGWRSSTAIAASTKPRAAPRSSSSLPTLPMAIVAKATARATGSSTIANRDRALSNPGCCVSIMLTSRSTNRARRWSGDAARTASRSAAGSVFPSARLRSKYSSRRGLPPASRMASTATSSSRRPRKTGKWASFFS